ncbi:ABC transporter ATP-binding protein [Sinorhizobium medicae]|uniref:Methionine ABC transporter ATP-binding protein n=1 Tax=Sinorhizobium medicae TaxID=110321 RepID=A0ABX4TM83_9HYPH|nr:ABC transporter ATP-binding protein [Sinorhizobium medicae]MBO1959839.1 ABC transporter ATP-binding protein [Sinorhizobium medicae]MDX0438808.1 ATP-binding cassette domain-containing protein [Sinorhizobium medicae]MDX0481079.1 ATP-binding cassette domain-containing protein [Sinorhizobium medicae]MDX0617417.1 ATP-binding cassette domain-containing protein [Sinorhizobium medicae]MDX0839013.1 ATP-binding cassette domain-containing protein [Sinorhizobium medicae]
MTALLQVRNLVTEFGGAKGRSGIRAVNDVSFSVERGRVLGLVGESGSGKSVTGFSIIRLLERPGRIASGEILFDGVDLSRNSEEEMRRLRGKRIAMVFQDPTVTLNPVLSVGTQMIEAVLAHESVSKDIARQRARDALGLVGIPSPEERLAAYPHQFSGGMRQRVAIAIAFLHKPDLIIADEPTTALDVTIQSQIIAEFQKLTEETKTAVIWITHDLAIVSRLADDIAVMYAGRLVETGPVSEVLNDPRHPYTAGLIASVPSQNQRGERLRQIDGMTPALNRLPQGCSFRRRCERADDGCLVIPELAPSGDRSFRCIHPVTKVSAS